MFVGAPRPLHLSVSHRHPVVPLRRPVLQDEVRLMDLRRQSDQPDGTVVQQQVSGGSVDLSAEWRVGSDWLVGLNMGSH